MASYFAEFNDATDAVLAIGGILADGALPQRVRLYEFNVGLDAIPALEGAIALAVDRGTTSLGASTPLVPAPIDPSSAASVTDAGENFTVNPTIGTRVYAASFNMRQNHRWFARPGYEIILPGATLGSLLFRTTTVPAGVNDTAGAFFEE